jgi:hypothetical protein
MDELLAKLDILEGRIRHLGETGAAHRAVANGLSYAATIAVGDFIVNAAIDQDTVLNTLNVAKGAALSEIQATLTEIAAGASVL